MKTTLFYLILMTSHFAFSIEVCEEPTTTAKEAFQIVSEQFEHNKDKRYILESLTYDYINCEWRATYSIPIEGHAFPEPRGTSYIYVFTNKTDIKLMKF